MSSVGIESAGGGWWWCDIKESNLPQFLGTGTQIRTAIRSDEINFNHVYGFGLASATLQSICLNSTEVQRIKVDKKVDWKLFPQAVNKEDGIYQD